MQQIFLRKDTKRRDNSSQMASLQTTENLIFLLRKIGGYLEITNAEMGEMLIKMFILDQ